MRKFLVALALLLVSGSANAEYGLTWAGIDGTCKIVKPGCETWECSTWVPRTFGYVVPFAECAHFVDWYHSSNPSSRLLFYTSGSDMPGYTVGTSFNGGMKAKYIRNMVSQLGGTEESVYLHFYDTTVFAVGKDTVVIPGTGHTGDPLPADSGSRVPNSYLSYLVQAKHTYKHPVRLIPNLTNPLLRVAYLNWILTIFSRGNYDGVFFDNYNEYGSQGKAPIKGGEIMELGMRYGTPEYQGFMWSQMVSFARSTRAQLHELNKVLGINVGNYHRTVYENPDSCGADIVHYEYGWDPVYCNQQSAHRLENLIQREQRMEANGVVSFWSSTPKVSYGGHKLSSHQEAVYNNLCFYLVAKSGTTVIFMRPSGGYPYGGYLNPGFDTLSYIPAMGFDMGPALGPAQELKPGVYYRRYQKATVYTRPRSSFDSVWGDSSQGVSIGKVYKLRADGTVSLEEVQLKEGGGAISVSRGSILSTSQK